MATIQESRVEQEFQPTHVTIASRTPFTSGADVQCSFRNGECPFGEPVRVTELDQRGSVHVQLANGDSGWVNPHNLAEINMAPTLLLEPAMVTSKEAAVLSSPNSDARLTELLFMGSIVHIHPSNNQWSQYTEVVLADSKTGWIETRFLARHPSSTNDPSIVASLAATSALKLVGTPFRDGGCTPCGINAAGLLHLAYRLAGLAISQSTFRIIKDPRFTPVEEGVPLEEGDFLVFQLRSERHLLGLALSDRELITVTSPSWPGHKEGAYVHSCGAAEFAGEHCDYLGAKRLTRM